MSSVDVWCAATQIVLLLYPLNSSSALLTSLFKMKLICRCYKMEMNTSEHPPTLVDFSWVLGICITPSHCLSANFYLLQVQVL